MVSRHSFVFVYSHCRKLENILDFVGIHWTASEKLFDTVNFG